MSQNFQSSYHPSNLLSIHVSFPFQSCFHYIATFSLQNIHESFLFSLISFRKLSKLSLLSVGDFSSFFCLPHRIRRKLRTLKHYPQTFPSKLLSRPRPNTFHCLRSNLKSKIESFGCFNFLRGKVPFFGPFLISCERQRLRGQFMLKDLYHR